MKIPIEQIFPDPDLHDQEKTGREGSRLQRLRDSARRPARTRSRKGRSADAQADAAEAPRRERGSTASNLIVKPRQEGAGFVLISGGHRLRAAIDAGEDEVECTVKERLTEQERWELQLAEQYHSSLVPPMQLGKAFMRYREAHGVTQQELARRTGITPGTIHHYESLIRTLDPELGEKVDSGDLTFKEARSIADLADHARQREIAEPFINGRLSSVHVERIVGLAKVSPELSIDELIEKVVNGGKQPEPAPQSRQDAVDQAPQPEVRTESLETTVLRLAGELDALQLQVIPEYRRLKLISSLRILDSRLRNSLAYLNGGQARESAVARPLARAMS